MSELTTHKCFLCRGVANVAGYSFRCPDNERLWFNTYQGGATQSNYTDTDIVSQDTWYHLVAIRSGTLAIFYRDSVNIPLAGAVSIVDPATNANNFIVGDEAGVSYDMAGDIGEVRIYRRELSPLEVQRNYLATKWRYK